MKKLHAGLCAMALIGASGSAVAMNHMKDGKAMDKSSMSMNMKSMDANGDGMISKDEFIKRHEAMWDKMKKNDKGMVDMKEMGAMRDGMMKDGKMSHDGMSKDNKMSPDAMSKDGKMSQDGMSKDGKMSHDGMKK